MVYNLSTYNYMNVIDNILRIVILLTKVSNLTIKQI